MFDRKNVRPKKIWSENFSAEKNWAEIFPPENLFINKKMFNSCLNRFSSVDFGVFNVNKGMDIYEYKSKTQPDFNKNLNLLEKDLEKLTYKNYSLVIAFQSEEQAERISVYFNSKNNYVLDEKPLASLKEDLFLRVEDYFQKIVTPKNNITK